MAKSWTSGGGEEEPLLEKQQVDRPFSGADDGIRTRDPHLGKGATSVHRRSPVFILLDESTANALAASHGSGRTAANSGDWGEKWGERREGQRRKNALPGGTRARGAAKLD